jgi:hypothetical protein
LPNILKKELTKDLTIGNFHQEKRLKRLNSDPFQIRRYQQESSSDNIHALKRGFQMGLKTGIFVLFFSLSGMAAERCDSLVKDLQAMHEAQKQLMASFIRKNDTMAVVLEENADQLENKMMINRSIKKTDLKSLRISAQTFRSHDEKEQALVSRFEKASGKLLGQVADCLTKDQRSH